MYSKDVICVHKWRCTVGSLRTISALSNFAYWFMLAYVSVVSDKLSNIPNIYLSKEVKVLIYLLNESPVDA